MVETRSTTMEVSGNSSNCITRDELRAVLEESFDSRMGDFVNKFQRMLEDILQKYKLHNHQQRSQYKELVRIREHVFEEKQPLEGNHGEDNQELEETKIQATEEHVLEEKQSLEDNHGEDNQELEETHILATTRNQIQDSDAFKDDQVLNHQLEPSLSLIKERWVDDDNDVLMGMISKDALINEKTKTHHMFDILSLRTGNFGNQKPGLSRKCWKFKFKRGSFGSVTIGDSTVFENGWGQNKGLHMWIQSVVKDKELVPKEYHSATLVNKSLFPRRWKYKLIDQKGSNEEVGTAVWYETQFSSKKNGPLVRTEAETLDSSKQFRGYRPGVSISIDSEDDGHKLDGQHKKAIQELYIGLSIGNYHVVEVNRDAVKGYDAAADVDKFFLQCLTFQQEEVAMYKASNVSTEMEDSIGHLLKTTKGSDGHILEKTGLRIHTDKNVATFNIMRVYFIGSVVSGVGSAPLREATAQIWVDMINEYEKVALVGQLGIQIIYGIDAVHGPNVYNVTILSHSVDLGATRDPDLVKRIGAAMTLLTQATVEVRATETPYTFTLCFAVCRDPRWDRCYEGYNEDHKVVEDTTNLILGLQEEAPSNYKHGVPFVGSYDSYDKVASCAQLYVGDGGVTTGINENNTVADLRSLLSLQMSAYTDAIYKASSTMMVSYSSWNGEKMCQQRKDVSVEFCYGSLPRPPEITWVAVLIFVNIFQLELHQHWLCCYRFSTHQSLGGLKFKWEVLFCFGSLPRPPEIAVDTFAKEPERILEIRRVQRKGRADAQVLIKWKKYSSCEPRGQGSLGREDLIQIITSAEDPLS